MVQYSGSVGMTLVVWALCGIASMIGMNKILSCCLPELALGRPRIHIRPCVSYVCLSCAKQNSGSTVSVLSKDISQLILLLTLCACWALADRPTASLFIFLVNRLYLQSVAKWTNKLMRFNDHWFLIASC